MVSIAPKLSKTLVDILLTNISDVQSLSFDAGHMGPIDEAQTIQFAIADFINAQKKSPSISLGKTIRET